MNKRRDEEKKIRDRDIKIDGRREKEMNEESRERKRRMNEAEDERISRRRSY